MLTAVALTPLTVGLLVGQIRDDLELPAIQIGAVAAAQWVGSSLSAWLLAPYADAWGWRAASVTGLVLSAVGQLAAGLLSTSGPALIVALLVAGVGYGLVTPTSNVVVVAEVPPSRRGLVIGTKQAAPPLAGILAGAAAPALSVALGWRAAFLTLGLLALAAAAYCLWAARGSAPPSRVPRSDVEPIPAGRMILLAGGLASLPIGAILAFTAISLESAGLGVGAAGLVVGAASAVSLATRIGGGWWADRTGVDGFVPAARLVLVGCGGLVLMSTGSLPLMLVGVFVSFGAGWGWPALLILGLLRRSPRAAAQVTGLLAIGAGAGAAAGPILLSAVAGHWGDTAGWLSLAALASPAVWLIGRMRRADPAAPATTAS
jgi:MFS family permease